MLEDSARPCRNGAAPGRPALGELDIAFRDDHDPVHFGQSFVRSDAFKALFREGMGLVEETAAYLDGPGRDESRGLLRQAALTYASESMRLTTRLMQIASWLLVQRALAEGEITPAEARRDKSRVRLTPQEQTTPPALFALMPDRLQDLVGLSLRLHARIRHLDALLEQRAVRPADSPAARQQDLLRAAFGQA